MLKILFSTVLCMLAGVICSSAQIVEEFPFDAGASDSAIGSVYIENMLTGDVIADVNGDLPMIPASVTKLVTAATVLESVPKDYRYETKVFTTGSIDNGVLNGNIVINSSGDPTLESSYFPEYNGFADSIVCALQRNGIQEIKGRVIVQYDKALQELTPKGWMESDLPWVYGAGYNAVNFKDNGFVLSLPNKGSEPYVPELKVVVKNKRGRLDYFRKRGSKTIEVAGRVPKRGVRERLANPNPEGSLVAEVEQKLRASGITTGGENIKIRNLTLLYNHLSAPLIDILKSTMYRSDNMMAEAALKLSAPGLSREKAAEKEIKLWQKRDVDCNGLFIEDGSGLSRSNRLSAYFLADILVWKGSEHLDFDFVELFPKCGEQGTVRNLLKGTPLQGKIALKSGSMKGVKCYAGYAINEDGLPTHAIVIMVNGFSGNMAKLKKGIESFLLEKIS